MNRVKKIIYSTVVGGIVLFLWGGFAQVFPWGIPTVQNMYQVSAKTQIPENIQNSIRLGSDVIDTKQLDPIINGKVSTLTTDGSFSWIISKPISYYNLGAYFLREIATQLFVALFLSLISILTIRLSNQNRLLIVLLASCSVCAASFGQLLNWWGLPLAYFLGISFNLIVGWLIAGVLINRFIIKSELKT